MHPHDAAHREHIASILSLLEGWLKARLTNKNAESKRIQAWRRLRLLLTGPICADKIYHYCTYGCHRSRRAVCEDLWSCMVSLFFDHPPTVPQFNKWTKIGPSMQWIAVFLSLGGALTGSMASLLKLSTDELFDISEEDVVGLNDQAAFRRLEQKRFRSSFCFMNAALMPEKMLTLVLAESYTFEIMGSFFKSARRYSNNGHMSIINLVHPSKSPAVATLRKYFDVLNDADSPHWLPLVGGNNGWTLARYHAAATPSLITVGSLVKRFIHALDCYPWRLALLVGDELTMVAKRGNAEFVLSVGRDVQCGNMVM